MDFKPRLGDVRRLSEQAVLDHINDRTRSRQYPAQKLRRLESLLEVPDHVLACQAFFQGFIFPEKDGFTVTCYLARDPSPFYGVMVTRKMPNTGEEECIMLIAPSNEHMQKWLTDVQFLSEGEYKKLGIETRCGAVLSEDGLLQLFFRGREAADSTAIHSNDKNRTTLSYKLSTSTDLEALVQELRPLRRFWRLHAEQSAAWNKIQRKHYPSSPTDTPKQKKRAVRARTKWWDTRGRKAVMAGMAAPYVPLVAPIETHHFALLAWFVRLRALFPASDGFVYSFQYGVGKDQPDEKSRKRYKCVRIGKKQENGSVTAVMTAILMSRCYFTQEKRPLDLLAQQQVWCTEAEVLCQTGRPAYLATIEPASRELTIYEIPDPLGPFLPVQRCFLTFCNTSSASERLHTRLYLKEIFNKITRDRVRFVEPEVEPAGKRERYAAKIKSLMALS
ncbi:uncharacterized protein BO66DRAFT_463860 [Aspergillus aculeatinus CBS 121060]|uniref:Uncharacterized protein n=1 Tax=Aspergillus aculeatinus CBS 121060 TaxID=1448322 RepID=A0ACD1GU14_9EURO|nr:hypothetical protein BO66DRAFT_463860 [Aspergillus aculeatinus CBS 121060]RAH64666.1 hypothetical protein BO66DRAFT_463860 [Aspergillus aculeatinus CBS 121060]